MESKLIDYSVDHRKGIFIIIDLKLYDRLVVR
jgi:hypothetical protein